MKVNHVLSAMLPKSKVHALLLMVIILPALRADTSIPLDGPKIIAKLENNYGERAGKRAKAWLELMQSNNDSSEKELLEKVNRFFNGFHFIDDIDLWGTKNYWATPLEFIGVHAGDCEDFAIAKYFTLLELGIADDKMRITMVTAEQLTQYHMVLTYYETPSSIPLVLDNLIGQIKPATERTDLRATLSFNGTDLWRRLDKNEGLPTTSSSRITQWRDLRQRLNEAQLKQPKIKVEL